MPSEAGLSAKPIVLIFLESYLPGYRAGGPIRSIANMVEALSGDFEFWIITLDHDFGDDRTYEGVTPDAWTQVGAARVRYLSRRRRGLHDLWKLIKTIPYQALYLNSFFSRRFSMVPYALWRLGLIRHSPLVLAPRGEFSPGALELKPRLKRTYLRLTAAFRWYQDRSLLWHASTELEAEDISRVHGAAAVSHISPPLAGPSRGSEDSGSETDSRRSKSKGALSVIFLSRISRKKNLDYAIRALSQVDGQIQFNIYGPMEDVEYWRECQQLISDLPERIQVAYQGAIPHEEVPGVLQRHDLFLFPTKGENYGHVIREALAAGCPVILSDQTPWRRLRDMGVGWDLSLDDLAGFSAAIQACVDMNQEAFSNLSSRASAFGLASGLEEAMVKPSRDLFNRALAMNGSGS